MKSIALTEQKNMLSKGYSRTSLGLLPNDWKIVKLSEYIESLDAGVSVNSEDYPANPPEKGILKTSAVNDGRFFPTENKLIKPNEIHRAKLNPIKDSIIISRMNTPELVGEIGYVDKDYPHLFLPDRLWQTRYKGNVCGKWLAYLLTIPNLKRQIKNIATGTSNSMKNISKTAFLSLEVPLVPIKEQQKIADILSTWDKAIELKEKLIEQKKEQKKGLMQRLLTGKVRLPGFKGDWKEVSLDKVVKKTKGQALVYVEGGKYPAIDMDYIETGSFRNYSNDATVIAKKTDVLLLWDGSRAGKAITGVEGSVGSTFVKLECKQINNVFLQKHLEMNEAKIRRLCEGSGIPHVPKDFLHYYKINLPSIEEQKAIAQILDCIDREIEMNEKELNQLKQQKKGLMQLLLTGKVRVKC